MRPAVTDPVEIWPMLWEGFSGKIGWDIGANCGQTIGQMVIQFEEVVAFEPAMESFDLLADHILKHELDTVTCHQIALSDVCGKVDLIVLANKIDTGQLVSVEAADMEYDPTDTTATIRSVPCMTVDAATKYLDEPDFLKIDVEGHELKVLRGARELLRDKRPSMLIEIHSRALGTTIAALLRSLGYAIETVRHPYYEVQSDLWYAHHWIRAFTS